MLKSASQRRPRRLVLATTVLAIGAVYLGGAFWQKWEQNRTERWVEALEELGVEVEVVTDPHATTPLGRLRDWLGIPVVRVFVWSESDVDLLLRTSVSAPASMLLRVEEKIPANEQLQLRQRFPQSEVRAIGGQGFF